MTEGAADGAAAARRVEDFAHELRIAFGLSAVADEANANATAVLLSHARALGRRVEELERAILMYLEQPGCNIHSRATAMQKLRHFAEKGLTP